MLYNIIHVVGIEYIMCLLLRVFGITTDNNQGRSWKDVKKGEVIYNIGKF